MIHKPSQVIQDIAARLANRIMPELTNEFAQADTGLLIGLLSTLAQDYERAAYNLDLDIKEMKELFERSPEDEARLAYIQSTPRTIHLADLTEFHDEGRHLLIELHAWAEAHDPQLNQAIWAYLRISHERSKFELPDF